MAALLLAVLTLAMTGRSSATWCVCKDNVGDASLQKTLDYACGAGADCNPIHSNGPCFNPNTIKAHCNFAVNSYFQRKGQAQGSCDFAGTATVTASDPSSTGCAYPSSVSASSTTPTTPVTTTTPSTTTPSTMNPSTNTPTSTTPYGTTTPTGVLGGVGTGLGPSGAGINTDYSGGYRLQGFSFFITLVFSGLMLLWG
ncbi:PLASMODESMATA CALLOSE-BINDING PROTEIN 3-like, partial [Herrania umbratica]|uniref:PLASMODESMATA CALLOSE-BINDING PROTEIN 3-like n=1 Tax=Herrania umbratica TaxID=108875 RepID=A0A6J1AIB1_9ROSI